MRSAWEFHERATSFCDTARLRLQETALQETRTLSFCQNDNRVIGKQPANLGRT